MLGFHSVDSEASEKFVRYRQSTWKADIVQYNNLFQQMTLQGMFYHAISWQTKG